MGLSKTVQYIVLFALALLTALNFYTLTRGRKKRKEGEEHFRKVFEELERKTDREAEAHGLSLDDRHGYLNDAGKGYFLSFDGERRMVGITTEEDFLAIPYDKVRSCTVCSEPLKNGKHTDIRVELETTEETLRFVFGTKQWNPKSHLGAFLFSDADQFRDFVKDRCGLE
jgi:hypothetical protein